MTDNRIRNGFKMSLFGAFITLWSAEAMATANLKGSVSLPAEDVLISENKPYTGQFDLRDQWGDNPRLTLTRVVVTFHFRDNDQWQMKERRGRPQKDGRPRRTMTRSIVGTEGPALEQHYIQEVYNLYSNPPEVARLQIGADRYYAATSHRRLEKVHDRGESRSFLGLKQDAESAGKLAAYSLTKRTLVERWDGYSDEFTIHSKNLSLEALRDLAEDGILPFTLDGEGDYHFAGATLDYEGYALPGFKLAGGEEDKQKPEVPMDVSLGLVGLISGGGLILVRRQRKQQEVQDREEARRRYGERRQAGLEQTSPDRDYTRAELEQMALAAAAEVTGQTSDMT
ncbi:hypothetical protein [Emcibacter sp.]|uniref:hypothetical protein n=1 Tax=Emcibacter sp. TaxID=1979954 RepID=UPI003A907429